MSPESDLARAFRESVLDGDLLEAGERVVVAVSGGVDSLVLLHLFRFVPDLPEVEVTAAHFDHRMRAGSGGDASWVRGLARAWDLPARVGRAESPPESEEEAREARYAFLLRVREEEGARWLVTAHHADDQAETVLFRVLRGTGLRGLRGIPVRRGPGIWRPLRSFWKEELLEYAAATGLRPRVDPSNRDPRFARNVIRHELLPRAEEAVAPGARRALVRLSRLARQEERALEDLVERALADAVVEETEERIVVRRDALLRWEDPALARLLRALARKAGSRLYGAGTSTALRFTRAGASGRGIDLPGGIRLGREFDRIFLEAASEPGAPDAGESRSLEIGTPAPGRGTFAVGGRELVAEWGFDPPPPGRWVERFTPSRTGFPLLLRSWQPGDRIRLPYGRKKLKKLLAEARIPAGERHRTPVVARGSGDVLWVPGVARADGTEPEPHEKPFYIAVRESGTSDADH